MKNFDVLEATKHWAREPLQVRNVAYSSEVMEAFGVQASGASVNATTAMRVSAVAACVGKISGAIISLPLNIYRRDGDDIPEKLPRDDLWYKLNEQPSNNYTSASFWEFVSMGQLLRGDSFVLIRRSLNGAFRELLPLPWGCVSPMRINNEVRYYVNIPEHNISTWFDPSDILHFPGLGFDDVNLRSMSVIQYGARGSIGNSIAMTEYAGKYFEGGAHPSMILSSPGKMNPEQVEGLQAAFVNKYSGSNAHKLPLVLTQGLKAEKISMSVADSQLIEGQKYNVVDICRAFGVPPHMVGETSGASGVGAGYEEQGRNFMQYTLQPWLKKIEQELNRKLFPRDSGKFIEFYRDALIEGDSAAQAKYFRDSIGGPGSGDGWMSVNEVRRVKRLAPIEGGEDVFRAQRGTSEAPQTDANVNNMAEIRQLFNMTMNNAEKQPIHVKVDAPVVNVSIPEQLPHNITNVINVPETSVNVEAVMPENNPVVNVEAPVVNVSVPPAQIINRLTEKIPVRDEKTGLITKIIEQEIKE